MSNTTIGGKYKVIATIGEGGMGTVFEVENIVTGKRAAIKRLHRRQDSSGAQTDRARVVHEARAVARIRHRNVVDIYDVFEFEDEVCLVMELLVGESLSARTRREPILLSNYVSIVCAAMRGVAAAHAVGVVHRDIKPDNIFLARESDLETPHPVVIDFGISKVADAAQAQGTRSGIAMGTPKYVSYEQLKGAKAVDERTDVYAFGVMLYEALTGRAPYVASSFAEQAISFVTSVPPLVRSLRPEIPPALARLTESAIIRDRGSRLSSVADFLKGLEPFAQESAYPTPLWGFEDGAAQHLALANGQSTLADTGDIALPPDAERAGTQRTSGTSPLSSEHHIRPGARRRAVYASLTLALFVTLSLTFLNAGPRAVPSASRTVVSPSPLAGKAAPRPEQHLRPVEPASASAVLDGGTSESTSPLSLPPVATTTSRAPTRKPRQKSQASSTPTAVNAASAPTPPEPESTPRSAALRAGSILMSEF